MASYSGPLVRFMTGFSFVPKTDMRFIVQVQTHRIGHKPATTGALLGGE